MKNEKESPLFRKSQIEIEINDLTKTLFMTRTIGEGTLGKKNFKAVIINETVPAIIIDNMCYSFSFHSMIHAVNALHLEDENLKSLESKGEDK